MRSSAAVGTPCVRMPRAICIWPGWVAFAMAEAFWASRAAAETESARAPVSVAPAAVPHGLAAVSVGRGLRFNNPFRLATPLGDDAESVSLSATYLDLTLGLLSVAVDGFQHGGALSGVFALHGIGQFGLTPSYLAQFAVSPALALHGRLGVPLVVAPDTSLGLETGIGSSFAVAFGLGVTAELVGSVFFGAATEESSVTTIPLLSLQIGLFFEHEVAL
jgi:hypothetical protein